MYIMYWLACAGMARRGRPGWVLAPAIRCPPRPLGAERLPTAVHPWCPRCRCSRGGGRGRAGAARRSCTAWPAASGWSRPTWRRPMRRHASGWMAGVAGRDGSAGGGGLGRREAVAFFHGGAGDLRVAAGGMQGRQALLPSTRPAVDVAPARPNFAMCAFVEPTVHDCHAEHGVHVLLCLLWCRSSSLPASAPAPRTAPC